MIREIPVEVLNFVQGQALVLDATLFSKCLASAPSGSAPGPGGFTNKMLKICLDDAEVSQLLFLAAQDMARAQIPESAPPQTFMLEDGGARSIATGTSFRRLVAKTLARQFGKVVESTCAMMSKLYTVPELRGLLPFVRSTYAHPTSCRWQDSVGVTHQVHQAEGGEQGD